MKWKASGNFINILPYFIVCGVGFITSIVLAIQKLIGIADHSWFKVIIYGPLVSLCTYAGLVAIVCVIYVLWAVYGLFTVNDPQDLKQRRAIVLYFLLFVGVCCWYQLRPVEALLRWMR